MRRVSEDLGNTVAVARKSYVDPRVVDHFEDGVTILPALRRIPARARPDARREKIERAVVRLLRTA
jgi:DNA topoisomerase IB